MKQIGLTLAFVAVIGALAFFVTGLVLGEPEEDIFPPEATNIEKLGNGWYTFELEKGKFLYRPPDARSHTCAITRI